MRLVKTIRPFLMVVAVLAIWVSLLFSILVIVFGPLHDFIGLRNTVYSSDFTVKRYSKVEVGMAHATVVDLLGSPLQTYTLTNYPVWALRDERVRRRYGTDAELRIETLSFSRAKNGGDYDMVSVWIGPDDRVIQHERWVTD